MAIYVVRVWLPDRPGALGAVASRIGAVRGDLVGIDILERSGGQAIDELVVDLPDAALVDLLVREIDQVDGVEVEDVRRAPAALSDARLDALETAALLVEQRGVGQLLKALVAHACQDFEAEWSAAIDPVAPACLATEGTVPAAAWLAAFVAGSSSSDATASGQSGPDDVAWARLPDAALALVVGRRGRPFRARERLQLAALTRIADRRYVELREREGGA